MSDRTFRGYRRALALAGQIHEKDGRWYRTGNNTKSQEEAE
jgi:hypothetical protein